MDINILKKIKQFISYWYVRYILATELYMVEPWERVVIHVVFVVLFGLFWYFNYSIINSGILQLRSEPANVEQYS